MRIAPLTLAICLLGVIEPPARGAAPPITALTFAPDGRSVVVGSQAGLYLRTWPDLKSAGMLATELVNVHDLAFAPDGKTLAAVGGRPGRRGMVELFRWPEGHLLHRTTPHRDLIYGVAWRPDSAVFATGSVDKSVTLHAADTAQMLRMLEGHSKGVLAVAFLPGDGGLVSAGIDESLRVWNANSGQLVRTLTNHTAPVHDVKVRPSRDRAALPFLASVSDDRTVRLWQPTIGRLVRFARLKSPPLAIAWTPDGQSMLAACKDGYLRIIDPDTVEILKEVPALDGVAYALAVAPDGSVLVGGQAGQLRRVTFASSTSSTLQKSYGKIELFRDR